MITKMESGAAVLIHQNRLAKNTMPVESFDQIKEDVEVMLKMVDAGIIKEGKTVDAWALHHSQISDTPFNFFVINKGLRDAFNGRRVIVNPKITDQQDLVPFEEECVSLHTDKPFRTRRFENIKVEYQYPKGDGTLKFPHKDFLIGFPAFVFQHEFDHGRGRNIRDEFAEYNRPEPAPKKEMPKSAISQ